MGKMLFAWQVALLSVGEEGIHLFQRRFPQGVEIPDACQALIDKLGDMGVDVGSLVQQRKLTAVVRKYEGGILSAEYWFTRGVLNNSADGTPAVRQWRRNGSLIQYENWFMGFLPALGSGIPGIVYVSEEGDEEEIAPPPGVLHMAEG